jgi:PTS system glucitol/sorbitol-specific IIA component
MVDEFLNEGVVVLFSDRAPEELREFAILHDGTTLSAPIIPGDWVVFDHERYRVLAVGAVANSNLSNLGHLVMKCNGLSEPDMPGDICVESKSLPKIRVGSVLRIEGA